MAYLEIETRDGTHRVNLERDRLSIGRLSYNDVVLPYAQISRQHAELRLVNGQWHISDLHSTNGIQINSRRVHEYALTTGDEIILAPGISVRFVLDVPTVASGGLGQPAQPPQPNNGTSTWAERIRQQIALPGGASPASLTQPVRPALGTDPFVPPDAFAPLRPRSAFSDDEVRYVPPSMQSPAVPSTSRPAFSAYPAGAPGIPNQPPSGSREPPFSVPVSGTPSMPGTRSGSGTPYSIGSSSNGHGGYPAPPGPLRSGAGDGDPFLREGPRDERQRATSGPALNVLHVCQTCGQRTAPDAIYCQSCHHSIARECSNCRLSLLPIQERCPRCHMPNAFSVRRAHSNRTE